jgi:hypothetical protein
MTTDHRYSVTQMNIRIAEALGFNPKQIKKNGLKITLDGELGPIVEVQFGVWDNTMVDSFCAAVARYKLIPIDDDDEELLVSTRYPETEDVA